MGGPKPRPCRAFVPAAVVKDLSSQELETLAQELFIMIADLLVILAKLARPGSLGAVAAESLAVKHLSVLKPPQTTTDASISQSR